jgi:hypothetical protein
MATESMKELREFHNFLEQMLRTGGPELSPEEALDEWRREHPQDISDEELAAIREALDDIAKGDRGMSFDEFDRGFRTRHNLSGQ